MTGGGGRGDDHPVRLYATVLESQSAYRLRSDGKTAIVQWLVKRITDIDRAMIVLHEDERIPGIVRNQDPAADVDVLTTGAFLKRAQKRAPR